jgi:hypothetical protein
MQHGKRLVANIRDLGRRCSEHASVHQAVVGGVASRSAGRGAVFPTLNGSMHSSKSSALAMSNWRLTLFMYDVGVMSGAEFGIPNSEAV